MAITADDLRRIQAQDARSFAALKNSSSSGPGFFNKRTPDTDLNNSVDNFYKLNASKTRNATPSNITINVRGEVNSQLLNKVVATLGRNFNPQVVNIPVVAPRAGIVPAPNSQTPRPRR